MHRNGEGVLTESGTTRRDFTKNHRAIIAAAEKIILAGQAAGGMTVEALADASGISVRTIGRHFAGNELVEAIIEKHLLDMAERARRALAAEVIPMGLVVKHITSPAGAVALHTFVMAHGNSPRITAWSNQVAELVAKARPNCPAPLHRIASGAMVATASRWCAAGRPGDPAEFDRLVLEIGEIILGFHLDR